MPCALLVVVFWICLDSSGEMWGFGLVLIVLSGYDDRCGNLRPCLRVMSLIVLSMSSIVVIFASRCVGGRMA